MGANTLLTKPAGKSTSYQLPELLTFTRPFELRTNRHCRSVSLASERWLSPLGPHQAKGKAKTGLLAALCFPTCDAPQLRLAADFLGLLLLENGKSLKNDTDPLFFDLQTRLMRTCPSPAFTSALAAFRAASNETSVVPDLESYIEQRRQTSGLHMILALIECVGGLRLSLNLSGNSDTDIEHLESLTQGAVDIIAWSWDILAFGSLYSEASGADSHNLVRVLMEERKLSVQGAVHVAGTLVKQSVDAFLADERAFYASRAHPKSRKNKGGNDEKMKEERVAYVRGLRDCIAGAVQWGYENEVWLGSRADEVREFGWVFLS